MTILFSKKTIRKLLRQYRKKIILSEQLRLAKQAALKIQTWTPLLQANNIAIFLSFDGELNTKPLIDILWKNNKNVYVPVLNSNIRHHLFFVRYHSYSELVFNSLKIKEPKLEINNEIIQLNNLNVLIIPLVAFDQYGNRLGMGGGFYDRILEHWKKYNFQLIGYAYDFQMIDIIPSEKWDIPLPAVVTPSKLWVWKNNI